MNRFAAICIATMTAGMALPTPPASAQQPLLIKPLAEKKVAQLPPGALFWRIETFTDIAQAQSAAGPWSLAAQSGGRTWLFTLGPASGATPGGNKVAELGPISRVDAPQYLLRINEATGPQGSITPIHKHPGSEAFFVLSGEQSIRGPHDLIRIAAGHTQSGREAGMPMQVASSGATDLDALVMFVVDATQPFSSPAVFP